MCKRKSSENKENESFSYKSAEIPIKKTKKDVKNDEYIEILREKKSLIQAFINILNKRSHNDNNLMDIMNRITKFELKPWPLAITLNKIYNEDCLLNNGVDALNDIDKERVEILKNACSRLNFSIVKAKLKIVDIVSWNRWWGNRWGSDAIFCHHDDYDYDEMDSDYEEYNHDEDVEDKILSREKEELIPTDDEEGSKKSKVIEFWFDKNGLSLLENNNNISVDFISKIIDLTDYSDSINSWIYQKRFHEYIGNGNAELTTIYQKDLLVFWPEEFDFFIMSNLNLQHAINLITEKKSNIHSFLPSVSIHVSNIDQNCSLAQVFLMINFILYILIFFKLLEFK